jgi:hypothetical protein
VAALLQSLTSTCTDLYLPYTRRKLDSAPVDETLRSAIRAFCTALVTALNR